MATIRERLQADIDAIEAQIAAARTALANILATELDSYDMENMDTRQRARNLQIEDLRKLIKDLETDRDRKYNLLNGSPKVKNIRLRR